MGKLENRIAIITGGARGIGRAIAEAFVAEGADVAIADKAPDSGSGELLSALRKSGRRAIYVQTDVSQEAEVKAMVERVEKELGPVEILVNDAGIFSQVLLHEMSSEQWDKVVNVNLRGVFLCTRYVLPHMLERGSGKIINIGSQLGQIGGHEMVHYSASKGGVLAFTKALTESVEVTSSALTVARRPAASTASLTGEGSCGSEGSQPMATSAPARANVTAVAAPIPDAAPVTRATRPVRSHTDQSITSPPLGPSVWPT